MNERDDHEAKPETLYGELLRDSVAGEVGHQVEGCVVTSTHDVGVNHRRWLDGSYAKRGRPSAETHLEGPHDVSAFLLRATDACGTRSVRPRC